MDVWSKENVIENWKRGGGGGPSWLSERWNSEGGSQSLREGKKKVAGKTGGWRKGPQKVYG